MEIINIRVLFVIDSMPCHRFLKEAQALSGKGVELYMSYRERGAVIARNADLSLFRAVLQLGKRELFAGRKIARFARVHKIEIIHYHNYPDRLCYQIMHSGIKLPIIFDQHDLMSLQRVKFSRKKKYWEQYCLEQANGLIFVTDFYQRKSFELYQLSAPFLILPNMVSGEISRNLPEIQEKLSDQDGRLHLVWAGLITRQPEHHRYMLKTFQMLSDSGFSIHVYPTRSKEYPHYSAIPHLHIHKQLSYSEMMKTIGIYDAGLAFFNPWMPDEVKSNLVKHAFPNKINDYIFAGVPPITLSSYQPMADYLTKYETGLIFDNVEEITPDNVQKHLKSCQLNIKANRTRILADIEQQLDKVIELYKILRGK
ncbi:MAG: glycosyltransferase [Candidatus Cloacimonetes bacterium]|nr:glycosyltransferase [Candidatus Cloacimonadota bacterium]